MTDLINGVPVDELKEIDQRLFRAHDYATPVPNGKTVSALGNVVKDTQKNAEWRQAYYDRVKKERESLDDEIQKVRDATYKRDMGKLNILGTTQVAEQFGFTQATAYNHMKAGIIPSFQVGKRWFTHDYVIDHIMKRGKTLVKGGYANRSLPRMVWRSDQGLPWR